MPPTALPGGNRYIEQGVAKYYWLPAVAAMNAPTRAEIDAGTDLTCQVAAIAGFTMTGNEVETPDACSRVVSKIPGTITLEDSSINFWASKDGDDAAGFFTLDQQGFILFAPGGDPGTTTPAAYKADVFPVRVKSVSRTHTLADAAQVVVGFSVTSTPAQNADLPAIA